MNLQLNALRRLSPWPLLLLFLVVLAACGGAGDDSSGATAPTSATATVGSAGGSVAEPAGAQVSIPAGALAAATSIGVESNAGGAPALPAGVTAAGPIVAFTPHGTVFAVPVTVTVPFDPAKVPAGQAPVLYKTNAAGAWERVAGATVAGSTLVAQVSGFSWFVPAPPPPATDVALASEDWTFEFVYTGANPAQDVTEVIETGTNEGRSLLVAYPPAETPENYLPLHPSRTPAAWYAENRATEDAKSFSTRAVAPMGDVLKSGQHIGLSTTMTVTRVMRKVADIKSTSAVFTKAEFWLLDGNPFEPGTTPNACPWSGDCLASLTASLEFTLDAWITLPNGGYITLRRASGSAKAFGWRGTFGYSAGTHADSDIPVWSNENFVAEMNVSYYEDGQAANVKLTAPVAVEIPLDLVDVGGEFTVQVTLTSRAYNRRQYESYASAFFQDPAEDSGVVFDDVGVEVVREAVPRPRPVPPPPPTKAPVPACPGGPDPAAGTLQLASATFDAYERAGERAALMVSRTGGAKGAASVLLTSAGGTARAGVDYTPVSTLVRFEDGEQGTRSVRMPIIDNDIADGDRTVLLTLSSLGGCAALGSQTSATLTLHDNDTAATTATYSVSGTVSGLAGNGLVLVDSFDAGAVTRPLADGTFTLRTGIVDRTGYSIVVQTQPSNPAQNCTVANGSGTIAGADVTNVAVTCTTLAASGSLDASFGSGGKLNNALPAARALAAQPDGRLLALGGLKLSRYNVDGSADTGFGSGGVVTISASGGPLDAMQGLTLQPDGRIVVAGWTSLPTVSNDNMVVLRFNADGSPDTTFGAGSGKVVVDFAGLADRAYAVLVQPDGRIVAAGFATLGTLVSPDQDVALLRLNADGSLDTSFGTGGKATANVAGKADFGYALARQPDGKLVVAGRVATDGGSNPDMGVLRFNADGSVDTGFGSSGRTRVDFGGAVWDEAADLALQADGAIVVGGFTQPAGGYRYALARLGSGGALDSSFGSAGLVSTPFSGSGDFGRALLLQADGRIVVAGQVAGNGANPDFGVARYGPTGALDTTFGAGGLLQVDFFGGADGAFDVVQMPDGRIVAGGSARNGSTSGLGLVRLAP